MDKTARIILKRPGEQEVLPSPERNAIVVFLSGGCSNIKININTNNNNQKYTIIILIIIIMNNIKKYGTSGNHETWGQCPSSPVGWRCSDVREREFTINLLELQ